MVYRLAAERHCGATSPDSPGPPEGNPDLIRLKFRTIVPWALFDEAHVFGGQCGRTARKRAARSGFSRRITELARLRLGWILSSGLRSFSGITAGQGESQHLTSPKS